jgi:hypothetical protein
MNIKGMEAAIAHARKHGADDDTTIIIDIDGDYLHLFTGVTVMAAFMNDERNNIIIDAVTEDRLEYNKEEMA